MFLSDLPRTFCHVFCLSDFLDFELRAILGKEEDGGEADGGSNRSERSEAEPGLKGESMSMSIGEPPELLCDICVGCLWGWDLIVKGSAAETLEGRFEYKGCLFFPLAGVF